MIEQTGTGNDYRCNRLHCQQKGDAAARFELKKLLFFSAVHPVDDLFGKCHQGIGIHYFRVG